ncbi:hypothetical protein L208DRAFT_1403197 [Tricholoma matsutake]|nr:hypothetical protein L208DRAFT_1403197 [Tricholoma matsutake 945]
MDIEYVMIGKGKIFPSNSSAFPDLEDFYRYTFPNSEVAVKDFLALKLPKESYALVHPSASTCFSTLPANDNVKHLITRAFPSQNFVEAMRKEFGQALLDGAVSVEDPSYKNSRLPLWSLQYWHEMYKVVDSQSRWRTCLIWLDSKMHSTATLLAVQVVQAWLSIKIMGAFMNMTTLTLVHLLDDEEISGSLIDMMATHLLTRASQDPSCTTVIEQLRFMHNIEKAKSVHYHTNSLINFLKWLEEQFKSSVLHTLYFPVHFKQKWHWLSFKIDFKKQQLAYCEPGFDNNMSIRSDLHGLKGDSLSLSGMPPPTEIIRKVQWWLEGCFNSPFKNLGNVLPHGHQHDGVSCSMCAINMIAHDALGDPLWTTS